MSRCTEQLACRVASCLDESDEGSGNMTMTIEEDGVDDDDADKDYDAKTTR